MKFLTQQGFNAAMNSKYAIIEDDSVRSLDIDKLNNDLQDWILCEGFDYDKNDDPTIVTMRAIRRQADLVCSRYYNNDVVFATDQIGKWLNTFPNYIISSAFDCFKPTIDKFANKIISMKNYTNDMKEDNTMSKFICSINGSEYDRTEGTMIDGNFYSFEALDESDDFLKCEECGEWFKADDMKEVDGYWYCNECFNELYVECEDCGEYVLREDAYYHRGSFYCDSCWDEYFICPHCGDLERKDEGTWIESEDQYVCSHCFRWHYAECACCGEWFHEDSFTWVTNEVGDEFRYCEDCLNNHAWSCSNCGRWFTDDVEHSEDYECVRCADHGDSNFRNTGDIKTWMPPHKRMNYGFKPIPCFCATDKEIVEAGIDWADDIPFYGFELEIDIRNKSYRENTWSSKIVDALPHVYCKQDCSLDWGGEYSGIEIVSHPATLAWTMEHKQDFENCFKMLTDAGWRSHEAGTCGLHVHISLDAMEKKNPLAVHNMLIIFDKFWNKLVKFSRRTESQLDHWARRYAVAKGNYKKIKRMAKSECGRYMAVNLQNEHTVELRMFRGTLKLETFLATLQLVDIITKKCIELGDDYRKLQMLSWSELVHSDYEELNAYLAERGLSEAEDDKSEVESNPIDPDYQFKVGDYIECTGHNGHNERPFFGWIRNIRSDNNFCVEVDTEHSDLPEWFNLHSCSGTLNGNVGRYVYDYEMRIVEPCEPVANTEPSTGTCTSIDDILDPLFF